jgi:hypothetical protein
MALRCSARGAWARPFAGSACGALLVVLLAAVAARGQTQSSSLELAVKASYLYKFAPFVEWPAGSFASPTAPLVLCVVGASPFDDLLDRAISGQHMGDHPIALRRMPTADRRAPCHILYAAGSATQPAEAVLAASRGSPVLTVTEAENDPQHAGIIDFVLVDNRVRFNINTTAAAENGLVISSKLLNLAVAVRSSQ